MNKYECAVIVVPSADSAVLDNTAKKYTEIITSRGGTLTKLDDWGKRSLAYEINYHREGYYHFYRFEGNNDVVNELNRQLRIDENVLRHMIVRDDQAAAPLMTEDEPPLRERPSRDRSSRDRSSRDRRRD